jgi:hypothetical protein
MIVGTLSIWQQAGSANTTKFHSHWNHERVLEPGLNQ